MAISPDDLTNLAPDAASMAAARKLINPKKWSDHGRKDNLIWAHAHGSGKKPYYTVSQEDGQGYKCSCPSRKFPCKHVLALLLQDIQSSELFPKTEAPDWVEEFSARKTKAAKAAVTKAANIGTPKKAASKTRENTAQTAAEGCKELENWIEDRLRLGLEDLLQDTKTFETIAARLNDAKAAALAGRVLTIPQILKSTPPRQRLDACIMELGRLVALCRAFAHNAQDVRLMGEVTPVPSKDDILINHKPETLTTQWLSLGASTLPLQGGFTQVTTHFVSLEEERFCETRTNVKVGAQISPLVSAGSVVKAKATFYPAIFPMRAWMEDITHIRAGNSEDLPEIGLTLWQNINAKAPWTRKAIATFGPGRFVESGDVVWYKADGISIPLTQSPSPFVLACDIKCLAGVWNGAALTPLYAHTRQMEGVSCD